MSLPTLLILGFATWRLSSLLANEDGPFKIFKRFRDWICFKHPGIGEGLTCEWCNSVWIGTIIVIAYYLTKFTVWLCLPLALSTITVMIKFVREYWEFNSKKGEK